MSDQKDIDKLFTERFQDFEASPYPAVWDRISQKLDAKERERKGVLLFPWWYKAAGIAAAIVLLFIAGNALFSSNSDELNPATQTTSTDTSNGNSSNSQGTNTNPNTSKNSSNKTQNTTSDEQRIANQDATDDSTNALRNTASENVVPLQNASNTTSQSTYSNQTQHTISEQRNAVVTNNQDRTNLNSPNNSHNLKIKGVSAEGTNTAVVAKVDNQQESTTSNSQEKNANAFNTNTSAVAENYNSDTTTEKEMTTETAVAEANPETKVKKSLLDVINELHDLEKEDTEVAETTLSKWSISPNAAPTYYNTISNGSPIDQTFADNSKVGDVNLSYGVNVGYDVSKRLTVRSGIHRVDYSYSTRDIALVPSIDGTDLTTIAFKTNDVSFDIKDRQEPSNIVYAQYQLPSSESSIREKQIEGNLNQRMSYIEVPVELKYAVLDTKIGVNVIGGVSTLLLTENSIILDSPELLAELGEATNLNDVSFSTNIGVGIDYKFSDQLEFNLEPMLKYQINTFSGNTGNFRPYSVGVYTGVSFRF